MIFAYFYITILAIFQKVNVISIWGFSNKVLKYSNADGIVDCFKDKPKIIRQKLKDMLLKEIEVLEQESKKLNEYFEKYEKAVNNNRSEATIRKHKDNYDNLVKKIENFFILTKFMMYLKIAVSVNFSVSVQHIKIVKIINC